MRLCTSIILKTETLLTYSVHVLEMTVILCDLLLDLGGLLRHKRERGVIMMT